MTYDRNQFFVNRVRLGDKHTEITAFVNKEKVFEKTVSPALGLSMAETYIKAAMAALDSMPPDESPTMTNWITRHGFHGRYDQAI